MLDGVNEIKNLTVKERLQNKKAQKRLRPEAVPTHIFTTKLSRRKSTSTTRPERLLKQQPRKQHLPERNQPLSARLQRGRPLSERLQRGRPLSEKVVKEKVERSSTG